VVFQLFNHGVFNRKERREKSAEGIELGAIFKNDRPAELDSASIMYILSIKDP
jgi:hypothetical protein